MMQVKCAPLAIAILLMVGLAGCGLVSNSSPKTPPTPPTITSISLSPQNSAVTVGKNLQLQAMGTFSDGTHQDISATAGWACSNTALATVKAGLVNGVSPGV